MNKSARYYLSLQALAYLRKETKVQIDDAIWNSRKSDGKKSTDFIDQQVAIHAAYNELKARYGDEITIMTGLEQHGTEGIIKPLPGLLVEPKSAKHCFVELTDGQHLFIVKKRIRKYIENFEAEEWEWEEYPDVYIVRSSTSDRARLRKYVEQQLDDGNLYEDDFSFHIVSQVGQTQHV